MATSITIAMICVAIWAYLILARGAYWRARVRDTTRIAGISGPWPAVAAVIPARNESDYIARSMQSLLRQDYRGPLTIVLVDDDSDDGTGAVATDAAAGDGRLRVIRTTGPAAGWTGKLWAVSQGIAAAEASYPAYLLLTDADIEHAPDTISWLVSQSVNGRFVLTSLMAKLRCVSLAEKIHVPAFIYFFQMLYPFAWVSRADSSMAAAAGGCMLVRADALDRMHMETAALRDAEQQRQIAHDLRSGHLTPVQASMLEQTQAKILTDQAALQRHSHESLDQALRLQHEQDVQD